MKKGIAFFVIFALLCSLWGCGQSEYVGMYNGVYVEADGRVYPMEDYFNGENYLELKPRGKALMMTGTTEHELTWEENEGEITFTESGDSFYGYINNGVISMDFMGWGMNLISEPNFKRPITIKIIPAKTVAVISPPIPLVATIPATTVANAAVGPAICIRLPPSKETVNPAKIAV